VVLTVLLARATFRSAIATEKSAVATKESAAATRQAAEASTTAAQASQAAAEAADKEARATVDLVELGRDQMTRSYLPMVLPARNSYTLGAVTAAVSGRAVVVSPNVARLTIKVRNFGVGPAIDVTLGGVEFPGQVVPQPKRRGATHPALAPGDEHELFLDFPGYTWEGNDLAAVLWFSDVFKNQYRTRLELLGGDQFAIKTLVMEALDHEGALAERIIGEDAPPEDYGVL
jgi:hypothetical protein